MLVYSGVVVTSHDEIKGDKMTRAEIRINLSTEDLVQPINDTGLLWWSGSDTGELEYLGDDMVEIPMRNPRNHDAKNAKTYKVTGTQLSEAFQKYTRHMSLTIANGKLEDIDLDASVANLICQVATYGEVVYA